MTLTILNKNKFEIECDEAGRFVRGFQETQRFILDENEQLIAESRQRCDIALETLKEILLSLSQGPLPNETYIL